MKLRKQSCGVLHYNLSEDQLSKWKQQVIENVGSLFTSTDKHASEAETERPAHLKPLVERFPRLG